MRIALVVSIIAATIAPALAIDMEAYNAARAVERRADHAKREADQKALCARVGGAKIGQTAEGVLASCWGKPARVNTTLTAGHRQEQWVYGGGQYLYLTDGVVTAAQSSR